MGKVAGRQDKLIAVKERSIRHIAKNSYLRWDDKNKRMYQMEKEPVIRPWTEGRKIQERHNTNVSASSLYKLEQYLTGVPPKRVRPITASERTRVIEAYGLSLNDSKNQWTTSKDKAFSILKERFERAGYYETYGQLWGSFYNFEPVREG